MAMFEDAFGHAAGTVLTDGAYVPTLIAGGAGTGSWAAVGANAMFKVSTANRCRVGATGTNLARCSADPAATGYDVEADFRVLTIEADGFPSGIMSHLAAATIDGYLLSFDPVSAAIVVRLKKMDASGGNTTYVTVTGTGISAGATYHGKIACRVNGADLDVSGYVTRASDGFYLKSDGSWQAGVIAFHTATDTADWATGRAGLWAFNFENDLTGVHIDNFIATDLALTQGVASFTSATATAITLAATAPTGGAGGYTYQWQRSENPISFSNLSGATALALVDSTAVLGTQYFYQCVQTDSAAASVTTKIQAAKLWGVPIILGFIGDSITVAEACDGAVAELNGGLGTCRTWTMGYNGGVPGSTTGTWVSGSSNLNTAKSAFASAGVTHVHVMLGANDMNSVAPATYASNLANMLADLTGAGYVCILSYPIYHEAYTEAAKYERLLNYQAEIDALVDGTDVLRGDQVGYHYFQSHMNLLSASDFIHPTTPGELVLAKLWAVGIDAGVNGLGAAMGGGGGAGSRLIGGV